MWPVNKVGINPSPAPAAASATPTSRRSMSRSTRSAVGWKSSQSRNSRTESMPLAAMRSKSRATSPASNLDHQAIAVRDGQ